MENKNLYKNRYRINQIKLSPKDKVEIIPKKIADKIGIQKDWITSYKIVKESVDAREKPRIYLVYTVDFDIKDGITLKESQLKKVEIPKYYEYKISKTNRDILQIERPIVVGFGPAGMFMSLVLARAGLKPIVFERGSDVDERSRKVAKFWQEGILDENCNVQFGEGGAGTFSDGKLTTGVKDTLIRFVLEEFVKFGATEDILYKAKPHIGTDVLRKVVKNLRNEVLSLGGEIYFDNKVYDINTKDDGYELSVKSKETDFKIFSKYVSFAIGHSSRDTFKMLKSKDYDMSPKPFSMGVRIEHDQDLIDIAQYGKPARELGLKVSDYKLNCKTSNGRGVYSFCMCPGGEVVISSSESGGLVTNGMSYYHRNSGRANSGLLVDVRIEDFESGDVLAGMYFQEKYEKLAFEMGGCNYNPPTVTYKEFKENKATHFEESLPEFIVESLKEAIPMLGKKLKGFDSDEAILKAIESRSSSPVRFKRDDLTLELYKNGEKQNGLYPVGEGAGYAGGIMSAAIDGIKVAEKIIEKFN